MLIVEGTKINKWTVIDSATYILNGKRYIDCRCECGFEKGVILAALKNGNSTQCINCKRAEHGHKLLVPGSGWNTFYYRYQTNAKNRGLSFDLTKEEFRFLSEQDCDYCGSVPVSRTLSKSQTIVSNGVDRVDTTKGYTAENCVPCCAICNRMKMDMTREDFLEHATKIGNKNK